MFPLLPRHLGTVVSRASGSDATIPSRRPTDEHHPEILNISRVAGPPAGRRGLRHPGATLRRATALEFTNVWFDRPGRGCSGRSRAELDLARGAVPRARITALAKLNAPGRHDQLRERFFRLQRGARPVHGLGPPARFRGIEPARCPPSFFSPLLATLLTPTPRHPPRSLPQALEKYNIEKDIAAFIKKEFDKKYNPTWHCIVGRNFGSYVTHETKHFIYFYLGQVAILLFKSG